VDAGHKVQKYKAKITPGFRLKSIAGMTPYLACAGRSATTLVAVGHKKNKG